MLNIPGLSFFLVLFLGLFFGFYCCKTGSPAGKWDIAPLACAFWFPLSSVPTCYRSADLRFLWIRRSELGFKRSSLLALFIRNKAFLFLLNLLHLARPMPSKDVLINFKPSVRPKPTVDHRRAKRRSPTVRPIRC